MCGIAGFFHFNKSRPCDAELLNKMTKVISYRGPDGDGHYIRGNIAIGHRRLSIIDLDTGNQPMFNEDKTIAIVFNGEIYNYIELRGELVKLGHSFKTNSDTEVIIKAYMQWGVDCQKKLNGMWGFALWDSKTEQLFLSRDRMGEKPLQYAVHDETFIFASELKSIWEYGMEATPNLEFLEIYLTLGYIPAPNTFYQDVYKLEPGCYLLVTNGKCLVKRYWDLPKIDEHNMLVNKREINEQFENLFIDSVKIRMRSDVPYGAFLSGGLDSSSIVALMSEISSYPVETFTIGFKEKFFDERALAKLIAEKFNTKHHEYLVEPDTFDFSLNSVAHHYDEPFGDSSAIPTGHVSKFAAQNVKMVLTGDGGDEVLSGYTIYQGEKFAGKYQKLPSIIKSGLPNIIDILSRPAKGSIRYKLNRAKGVCESSNMDFQSRYLNKMSSVDLGIIKEMTKNVHVYPVEEFLGDFMKRCTYKDSFYQLMFINLKLSLPNDMLVKVDRMSMAYSLETRTPFLDHRLVEYMVGVHKDIKMENFERKTVLRNTIGSKLPKALLNAPKKGFGVPLREWFKDASFSEKLSQLETSIPFIDESIIKRVTRKNNNGEQDLGNFIWTLFILNKVMERSLEPSF